MSEKDEISKALDAQTDNPTGAENTSDGIEQSSDQSVEQKANGQEEPAADSSPVEAADAVSSSQSTSTPEDNPTENTTLEDDQDLEKPQAVQAERSKEVQDASQVETEVGTSDPQQLEQSETEPSLETGIEAEATATEATESGETATEAAADTHTESQNTVAAKSESDTDTDTESQSPSQPQSSDSTPGATEGAQSESSESPEVALPWADVDFSNLDKAGLVAQIELMAKHDNPLVAEKASRELRPLFNTIQKEQKKQALEAFVAEGNEPDGFAYRFDELDNRFDAAFKLLRDRKVERIKDLERNKEKNLEEKNQLLEDLRALVEAEETNASINALKKIQERWRSLGPVPPQHAKTLWANYHALLDLYYDHRSIYYELKELDRKKNLTAKLDLCERAERLVEHQNLKEAISELNELHEEFKHIGPVPKSDQEALWQRFKGASDQIYARRKEFVKSLKEDLKENLGKKSVLADEVQEYGSFSSDRISDWNKKTQALLDLQKKWDAIGGLPRDQAKQVNRKFWGAFKGFFRNKGQFFKQLEGERESNLEKKQALVQEAEQLKDSTDWNGTANKLKNLQKQWREIGPVPEKFRNSIYTQFKEACDQFFNNKRAQGQEIEKEYIENLQKKQDICTQIESMTTAKDFDLDKFQQLNESFGKIGYVPGSEVRKIRSQYQATVDDFMAAAPEEVQDEIRKIKDSLEFEKLKSGPNANRKINQKEQALRREINALENDISTWKNNLEFFAASKTADKLREEFSGKIDAANQQLTELKRKLRAVRQL